MECRELDKEVAEKILGWTDIRLETVRGSLGEPDLELLFGQPGRFSVDAKRQIVPYFSDDIGAAWLLIDHAVLFELTAGVCFMNGTWMCCIGPQNNPFEWIWWRSSTAEEAICRCALKAKSEGLFVKKET